MYPLNKLFPVQKLIIVFMPPYIQTSQKVSAFEERHGFNKEYLIKEDHYILIRLRAFLQYHVHIKIHILWYSGPFLAEVSDRKSSNLESVWRRVLCNKLHDGFHAMCRSDALSLLSK